MLKKVIFSATDGEVGVIVVTSSGPSEGKSTTSTNLAVVTGQNGKKIIIIDCDQRKPKLHKTFYLQIKKA